MSEDKPIADLIAELRRLLAEATPGRWQWCSGFREAITGQDIDLCIALRNAAPRLLDELERLQKFIGLLDTPISAYVEGSNAGLEAAALKVEEQLWRFCANCSGYGLAAAIRQMKEETR